MGVGNQRVTAGLAQHGLGKREEDRVIRPSSSCMPFSFHRRGSGVTMFAPQKAANPPGKS